MNSLPARLAAPLSYPQRLAALAASLALTVAVLAANLGLAQSYAAHDSASAVMAAQPEHVRG